MLPSSFSLVMSVTSVGSVVALCFKHGIMLCICGAHASWVSLAECVYLQLMWHASVAYRACIWHSHTLFYGRTWV
jgi:hypothetical protein